MGMVKTLTFYATPEHECSYLPQQQAQTMFADPRADINSALYTQLTFLGFRRSGSHYYRPHCEFCNACKASRIPVDRFKPNRNQRRIIKKNQDLTIHIVPTEFSEEHYSLYEKYITLRHADGDMFPPSREQYHSFIIDSPDETLFIEYRLEGNLVGLSVTDKLDDGLSAIYTYYEPDLANRSLGTFAILNQISEVKKLNLSYLYLGYWIKNCRKMAYKHLYNSLEILENEHWVAL